MGKIQGDESVVAICSTAVGTDDSVGLLMTLEAINLCKCDTDGYMRCSHTTEGCAALMKHEIRALTSRCQWARHL